MDFGSQHFKGSVHLVGFEKHPDGHELFDRNLDVSRILFGRIEMIQMNPMGFIEFLWAINKFFYRFIMPMHWLDAHKYQRVNCFY
ncbi:hypothetical protein EH221_02575 [bacterium]|nr:MAG: hypothetical protein EH221_02575 [bacterium]